MSGAWSVRSAGLLVGALLTVSSAPAAADEPQLPPTTRTISSRSKGCSALSDAEARITTAFRTGPDGRKAKIWTVPGWHGVAALSADCDYLVTGYDGMNLIPLDFDRGLVMLTFYRRGALIRQIRLDQLVRDLSKLRRTASHFHWGNYLELESDHLFRVETVDRGVLLFDMRTGLETSRSKTRAERGDGGAER